MRKTADRELTDAVKADARAAWDALKKSHPGERVYAFCIYTTACADFLAPTACGEGGLREAATYYVKKKIYPVFEDAVEGLRWSIADSPHHDRLLRFEKNAKKVLSRRPRPHMLEGAAETREIRARFAAAAAALKELDREGTFGRGAAREKIILLLASGDGEEDSFLAWARRLNPAKVFRAYQKLFERPRVGKLKGRSACGAPLASHTPPTGRSSRRRRAITRSCST